MCSLDFVSVEELKSNERAKHEDRNCFRLALLSKIVNLQTEVSEQRLKLSLFEHRNCEIKSLACHCKRFCRIYHQKTRLCEVQKCIFVLNSEEIFK